MERLKILLDTDVGDDIDDALAIALGVSSPEIDFVGITTVYINTNMRARLAKKLLCGYPGIIPVYAGYGQPLEKETNVTECMSQYTEDLREQQFAPLNEEEGVQGKSAVDFIIESCYKYKKELILLAIGPFTNLAKVIEKDKEALNQIKKVVIMGGCFYTTFPEWNILCDEKAASVLFSGVVHHLECIGLDVTRKLKLTEEEIEIALKYRGKWCSEVASKLLKLWMDRKKETPILHDPLALYYCMDASVVEMEEKYIDVVTKGEGSGLTLDMNEMLPWRGKNKVLVAKDVDRTKFMKAYFNRVFDCNAEQDRVIT